MSWGLQNLLVRHNERITVGKWNALVRAVMQNRIVAGFLTRPSNLPSGTSINITTVPQWDHPWMTIVAGDFVMVNSGLINGMVPMIQDANSGSKLRLDDPAVPLLRISSFDNNGKGWVALEVTLNSQFKLDTAEVIQCSNIQNDKKDAEDRPQFSQGIVGIEPDGRGRFPLARLIKRPVGIDAYQVSYFNLQHKAKPPATRTSASANEITSGVARHFFWAS